MPDYYEVLGITPATSVAEIENAYEEKYNHWRRLVTHHDPDVAEKANRALRILQQIRTTLTDPARRAAYDDNLNVGGLADPQAQPRTTAPPPPRASRSTQTELDRNWMDGWVCSQCRAANAIGTRFCKSCGNQIGIECPKCGELIEAGTKNCTHCGVTVEEFIRQQQWEKEAQRRRQQQVELEAQQAAELEARRSAWARKLGFGPDASRLLPTILGALIGFLSSAIFVEAHMADMFNTYPNAPGTVQSTAPVVGMLIGGILGGWMASESEKNFSLGEIVNTIILGALSGIGQAIILYLVIEITDRGVTGIIALFFVIPAIALVSSIFSVTITSILSGLVWGVAFSVTRLGLWSVALIGRSRAG